jgi:hypothetical protein
MPLTVLTITINLQWLYAVDCLRHNHSNWMVISAVDSQPDNHPMVMLLTVEFFYAENIQRHKHL